MSILDALMVSLIGITIVFFVLIALSFILVLQNKLVRVLYSKKTDTTQINNNKDFRDETSADVRPDLDASVNILKTDGVDEQTAALIMAIVSDESQIPLSELSFKYIKALD